MELPDTLKTFLEYAGKHLPPWAILIGIGLIIAAAIVIKRINRPGPTISIQDSTFRDVAGRDMKKND